MNRKVLIADDSEVERLILTGFTKEYYDVITATDGEEALNIILKEGTSLSLILLDIMMPKLTGFEVLAAISSDANLRQIPIIITTSLEDQHTREKAVEFGVNGFITKPYNKALILHSIQNVIQLHETITMANTLWRDQLTGLLNRESFFIEAERFIKQKEKGYYVLACIDIDNFKIINDQYGTEKGDEVLKHIAHCINNVLANCDGIACRFMADRFALLYPENAIDSNVMTLYRKKLTTPACLPRSIRVRIGRYFITDINLPVSAMFDRATLAEESIKGRYDTFISNYDDVMRDKLLHEQKVINEMEGALTNEEFEAWFQPQFNHVTGSIIGAEALVRWRHDGHLIPPNEFIPIFERNGSIYEIDQFIWRKTCIILRDWMNKGKSPLPISVNISRYDLFQSDFFEVICGLIKEYDIPTNLLRLEVTESAFSESTKTLVQIVNRLIDYGFTVEIDDFGSGYSSLNTLKDVPAEILKLDMKFLEDSSNSKRGGSIIESIVRMARWLGMGVIAEGVETIEQADYLKSIGCVYIQGYFYSKPIPLDEYEKLCDSCHGEKELSRLKTVESWNNNAFWDPKSMETLIFNTYIGGACIFEYCNSKIEILRSNERYDQIFSDDFYYDYHVGYDSMPFFDANNKMLFMANVQIAIDSKKESTCEVRLSGKTHQEKYLRFTIRLIAVALDRFLLYCVAIDITKEREGEIKRWEAEKKEMESARQLQIIMGNINGGVSALKINDDCSSFVIFCNDNYYNLFGYTRAEVLEQKLDIMSLVVPEDVPFVMEKVQQLKRDKKPITVDYRGIKKDGQIIYVRVHSSLMSMNKFGDDVITSVVTDVTQEKEANDQLVFLNDSAHDILAQDDSEKAIDRTLERLLNFFAGDRAYIVELDKRHKVSNNTYEICRNGVSSEKQNLQNIPFSTSDYWYKILAKNKFLSIEDVSKLSDENSELRTLLVNQNIQSIMIAPLWRLGKFIGFAGIDNPSKSLKQFSHLLALCDYVAILLTRRDLSLKIASRNKNIETLMNDTPGGFCRVNIGKKQNPKITVVNDGLCKILGMNQSQVLSEYGDNIFNCVYSDDIAEVKKYFKQALKTKDQFSIKSRLQSKDGQLLTVMLFGRFVKDENGNTFLNLYFNDITESEKASNMQKQLLDNLPCGAALYEFDGKRISVVHINRKYWELVDRDPSDYDETSVFDMIYSDDKILIYQEIEAAIRQKRDAACDVRIRCGESGYKPFHITATITNQNNGKYIFYVSYTQISEETMSIQDMLPVALSTVMTASNDLSFIKSSDLHFICCSDSFSTALDLSNPREIIGKTDYDFFPKELADHFIEVDKKVIETALPVVGSSETFSTPDGNIRFSDTSKYPLLDSAGRVIGIYGVMRDVTAAKENESQLQLLTSSIPGGIASFSIKKDEIKNIFFNEGFYKSFGFTREEYIERTKNNILALLLDEDRSKIKQMIADIKKDPDENKVHSCIYRCITKNDDCRWMNLKSKLTKLEEDNYILNVVQLDVTEQKEIEENLRIAEEEYRLATIQSGNTICRFDVASRTLVIAADAAKKLELPEFIEDVPYGRVKLGRISSDTAEAYIEFYENIIRGEPEGVGIFKKLLPLGWRWIRAHSTTLFSEDKKPIAAIVTYSDITEQQEKEAVFNKWHQSLEERDSESYTLFRFNLSKNTVFDSREGKLLKAKFSKTQQSFSDIMKEYSSKFVFVDDKEKYEAFINSDTLLANYYREHRSLSLDYREIMDNGEIRWLSLSIDLVEYPNSKDVEAYMMYENIDEQKKEELLRLQLSEIDPLTGVFNRSAFTAQFKQIIQSAKENDIFALLMFDIDNFKKVNDTLGHSTGDFVLKTLATKVKGCLRRDDIVGRLGGDEFFVFLKNIPDESIAIRKATQICATTIPLDGSDIEVTTSIGIAMIPKDGSDFDVLYQKVDEALYQAKKEGKNTFKFVK